MTNTPDVANIIASYLRATDSMVSDGMTWYPRAHEFALSLDPTNVSRAAGVIAVLSPNTSWTANMTLARAAYAGSPRGLGASVAKAVRILSGEPSETVIGGPKVTAFYLNILEPHVSHSAVIDRHAFDIAVDMRGAHKAQKARDYVPFANAYAEAASLADIPVSAMQAITWVEWRDRQGIRV